MEDRCVLGDIEFRRCECCGEPRAYILGEYCEPHDLVEFQGISMLATEAVWAVVDELNIPARSLPVVVREFLQAGLDDMQALVDGLCEKLNLLSDDSRAPGAGRARGSASASEQLET